MKNMLKAIFAVMLLYFITISACSPKCSHPKPVNPNASKKAVALLDFLYEIRGKYILSGMHNPLKVPTHSNDELLETVGQYPAIWGSDFSYGCKDSNLTEIRQGVIDCAKEMSKQGSIITLMWHSCFPTDGEPCCQESIWVWDDTLTTAEWDSLTTKGTHLNDAWCAQADRVAKFLKQLRDADVPVLWRPYHEMNGVWFWWCQKPGPNGFAKLWRMMYDYFTNYHQLNNLIWVWNTNAPRDIPGDEAYPYADYFPGLEYVDILAADVYKNDWKQSHHDDLLKLAQGKLIALGEVGHLPLPAVLDQQPQWSWFYEWNTYLLKHNKPETVQALFADPRVITLDELSNKNGHFKINIH